MVVVVGPVYMATLVAPNNFSTIVLGTEEKERRDPEDPEALLIAITSDKMQTPEALVHRGLLETPVLLEAPVHLGTPELLEMLGT
jgi:hypothetical protein